MQAVRNAIKTGYASVLCGSGLLDAWLRVRPGRRAAAVLNYHDVPPGVFEAHVLALRRSYRIVPLDTVVRSLDDCDPPPANGVAVTFDDACRPFHDEVYPILVRHQVPATMFVPTGAIDDQAVLWFNRVRAAVFAASGSAVQVGDRAFSLAEGRRRAYRDSIAWLNGLPIPERDAIVHRICETNVPNETVLARKRPMTWDQLRAMRDCVRFGAHTVSHPNLAILDDLDAAREIETSKCRLEQELGKPVRFFAYPFGRCGNIGAFAPECVRRAGFDAAVTTERGSVGPGADRYRLPRMVCDDIADARVLSARLSDLWLFLST